MLRLSVINTDRVTRRSAAWMALVGSVIVLTASGCNTVLLLGYLIGGPPTIEPDFTKTTKKQMEKAKLAVVICYAPDQLKYDNDKVDYELTKFVASRFRQNKIKTADPDQVFSWMRKNPNWDRPAEMGEHFDATYVVYIDLKQYSLYEEHSQSLFRGRADVIVSVVEMSSGEGKSSRDGKTIYTKELSVQYPTHSPYSADAISYANFKKLFLTALSDQIGWLFYERLSSDGMQYGALN